MKTIFVLLLLAVTGSFASFAGGCTAQPTSAPDADYCSGNQGRCWAIVAMGSGETTECTSSYYNATCNKYDQYGSLIASNSGWCIDY